MRDYVLAPVAKILSGVEIHIPEHLILLIPDLEDTFQEGLIGGYRRFSSGRRAYQKTDDLL